ncbi:hypothetical protein SLOPH_542, partial [Spraguea lophii 42_110]
MLYTLDPLDNAFISSLCFLDLKYSLLNCSISKIIIHPNTYISLYEISRRYYLLNNITKIRINKLVFKLYDYEDKYITVIENIVRNSNIYSIIIYNDISDMSVNSCENGIGDLSGMCDDTCDNGKDDSICDNSMSNKDIDDNGISIMSNRNKINDINDMNDSNIITHTNIITNNNTISTQLEDCYKFYSKQNNNILFYIKLFVSTLLNDDNIKIFIRYIITKKNKNMFLLLDNIIEI